MPENVVPLACPYCSQRPATQWRRDRHHSDLAEIHCDECAHIAGGRWTPLDYFGIPAPPTLDELTAEVVRQAVGWTSELNRYDVTFDLVGAVEAMQAHPDYRGEPDA